MEEDFIVIVLTYFQSMFCKIKWYIWSIKLENEEFKEIFNLNLSIVNFQFHFLYSRAGTLFC